MPHIFLIYFCILPCPGLGNLPISLIYSTNSTSYIFHHSVFFLHFKVNHLLWLATYLFISSSCLNSITSHLLKFHLLVVLKDVKVCVLTILVCGHERSLGRLRRILIKVKAYTFREDFTCVFWNVPGRVVHSKQDLRHHAYHISKIALLIFFNNSFRGQPDHEEIHNKSRRMRLQSRSVLHLF